MHEQKIQTFTDLEAWQVSYQLNLDIYSVTKIFPKEEVFGLTSQLRRASVSVSANIAEGFGRRTAKEKIRFYDMSIGSITEIKSHLLISKGLQFITEDQFNALIVKLTSIHRLTNGLIRTASNQPKSSS